ncbi:MAG: adenylate kinase [Clostridia bacterium]|nr:adenylate kinase [Clostridia bacterium]
MKIVLLGAPGCGKGTHAQRLTTELGIPHVSTGDIFRQNLKEQTELGKQIAGILAKGDLVSDEITVAIVRDRLSRDDCKNGYILDGFPRSLVQAEALESFDKLDVVVNIDVDYDTIIKRISGRRFCPKCSGTFHVSHLTSDTCPVCGDTLIIRSDDREEAVRNRLEVYESTTKPLIDFYRQRGLLKTAKGDGTVEENYANILKVLK